MDGAAPTKRSSVAAGNPALKPAQPDAIPGAEAWLALRHAADIEHLVGPVGFRRRLGRWRPWLWFVLLGLVVAGYVLAVVYLRGDKLPACTRNGPTPCGDGYATLPVWQRLVDSLRIFPAGFPGYDSSQAWQYNFARYLASGVFLLASFRLLALAFSERLAELRAWRRRDHVIVCGLGDAGRRSVRAFRAGGAPVTCLETDPGGDGTAEARVRGALVLRRDATQMASLGSARVDRAREVVCACADDATNTRVATLVAAAASVERRHAGPDVYVRVENPDLAELLRGRLPAIGATVFHFFSADAVWARALLEDPRGPFAAAEIHPPHVIVLGNSELGHAVVVGAARHWHEAVRRHGLTGRARITLSGAGAARTQATLIERCPAIPRICDFDAVDHLPESSFPRELHAPATDSSATAVYVCVTDPGNRLAAAFDAAGYVGRSTPIFVPAVAAAALVAPLSAAQQIHVVDLSHVESVDLIHDQMRDRFAREVHAAWLAERRGQADFGQQETDREWDELTDGQRRWNYTHVQGMSDQLQAFWYEIEPLADWDEPPLQLPETTVEAMAELEHARWYHERLADGWRHAPVRNDARKRHNLLVPWSELSEEKRNLDRRLVRERPAILGRAGYRLVHTPVRERLARRHHERYRADEAARGNETPGWDELGESLREANRAAVDGIAVQLARIGCRPVPYELGFGRHATFTDAEVEQLAELEHERWLEERQAAGWTHGPRDDDARRHPSIVPWNDLDEKEREKDRDVVRGYPALLEEAGLMVVRD